MTEQILGPDRSSPAPRRAKREVVPGKHAQADGLELRSYDVGALPLLNRIVERMTWTLLYALADEHGREVDELYVCGDDHVHSEGYRLLWYRSTRKGEQDQSRRARSIQKGTEALSDLRARLQGPRTRFRERSKVEQAVAETLTAADASSWLLVEIEEEEEGQYLDILVVGLFEYISASEAAGARTRSSERAE